MNSYFQSELNFMKANQTFVIAFLSCSIFFLSSFSFQNIQIKIYYHTLCLVIQFTFIISYLNKNINLMLPKRYVRLISQIQRIKAQIEANQLLSIKILEIQEYQSAVFLFAGPIDSPYQSFWFRIKVQWGPQYPYRCANYTLIDKIWNPYVDFETNKICIDIVEDQYSPALKTTDIIHSISSLLGESKIKQNHDGFVNPQAAIEMIKNYPYFCEHARTLAEQYSYKKEEIYHNEMRGIPEEHVIEVEQGQLQNLIVENFSSKQFNKKPKNQQKKQEKKVEEKKLQNPPELILQEKLVQELQSMMDIQNCVESQLVQNQQKEQKLSVSNLQDFQHSHFEAGLINFWNLQQNQVKQGGHHAFFAVHMNPQAQNAGGESIFSSNQQDSFPSIYQPTQSQHKNDALSKQKLKELIQKQRQKTRKRFEIQILKNY